MADSREPASVCCDCESPCLPGQLRCAVCQMRHEAQADVAAALAPLPPLVPQYSLATLFFSITWIGICLGALKMHACLGMLLIFLTMLSANLAVLNFLPIPVLDGGHMLFLLYEGLMGKPVNERVAVGLTMMGLCFLLTLMIIVFGWDLYRLPWWS